MPPPLVRFCKLVTDEEVGQLKTMMWEPVVTDGLLIQFMQRML